MPFVAAAIGGSAVLGYLGSQAGASAAESANAQNIAFQREANAANLAYQKENNAANRAQIEKWNTLNDPFSAGGNREQYVSKLNELMNGNPSDIYNDPIFQGSLNLGNEAISRRFASGGNGGSGAEQINLMQYTTGAAQTAYQDKFKRLSDLSGANSGRSGAPTSIAPQVSTIQGMSPTTAYGMDAAPYQAGMSGLNTLVGIYGNNNDPRTNGTANPFYRG